MTDVVSPVLVGRAEELEQLAAAIDRTASGEPGVVLVGGEAGVGKSRLLEAALAGRSDVRVLTGGCVELGGEGLPLVPLVDALRIVARTTPPDDLDALLGPARAELARLLPELALPGTPPEPSGGSTAQLFELVLGVLGRIGQERPLVLIVEDLHWADRSTLELVAFLVRALQGMRVLLVLTYRSDEVDRRSPLRPLLSTWERLRGVERLQLARFTREEVAAQAGAILGTTAPTDMTDLLFERSEGNAFFVEELIRTLREGASADALPPSLRDVLLDRAERLSGPARRLLRTAAVAGRGVPERLLAEVAAVPPAERYEALREAVDASLLVVDPTGSGYAFRHALTRDAVYQDLLPGERVDLHTAYAEALDRDPGLAGEDASVTATLAVHWYAAHDLPRALAASVRAGREAAAAFAPAEALRHLERALEVWRGAPDPERWAGVDQVEVLSQAGRAAFRSGDPHRALSLFQQALDQLESDPERAALVIEQRAHALRGLGESALSVRELEEALARLPEEPPTRARAMVLASLANTLVRLGDERGAAVSRTALEAARAAEARVQEASALVSLGSALSYIADAVEGEAILREGLRVALEIGDPDQSLRGYVNLSDALETWGRHREAAQTAREGIEMARRVGQYRSFGVFLVGNLVDPLVRLGEWADGERYAREGLASGPTGVFAATLLEKLGYQAAAKGRPDEAEALVAQARRHLEEQDEPQFVHSLAYIQADAARTRGDLAGAAAVVTEALREVNPLSARYAWPLIWLGARIEADLADHARDRNAPPPAGFMAGKERSADAHVFSPSATAYQAATAAEQARRDGRPAVDAWREAVAAWERAGEAWPLAYARFRLAEALCTDGAREEAAEPLRLAVRTAEELGARPLMDEGLALARRARVSLEGDAPAELPSPGQPAPFGLTDREREVLALVAAGQSNGQIAAALFISKKTASVHVSNILAKLGVSGRFEAAGVAHRHGLVDPRP